MPVPAPYTVVLVALLATFVVSPVLRTYGLGGRITGVFALAIPLLAVYGVATSRRHLAVAGGLALASAATNARWLNLPALPPSVGSPLTALLFFVYATGLFLRGVVRSRRVTRDVLAGALASYLMLGITWAFAYVLVDQLVGRAFSVPIVGDDGHPQFDTVLYFSLVTLLTVGYGDIAPVHGWARSLATLEAFTGFTFGTIVLARLVATYLASQRDAP
jgi:hypothetical protein